MQLTVRELCDAVAGTLLFGNERDTFRFVSTDSRKPMTTELFIPLVGDVHDGHSYIESAVSNGAKGFLTQTNDVPCVGSFCVKVHDTTKALGDLAAYVRKKSNATVIGITGSVGKTTTRQFVAMVVSQLGKTLATSGNFNNHIGLPLTILQMEGDEKYLVLEMGMNHFDEISYLSKIARPDIGIITLIGTSHIEYLGSRENILRAKMEITHGMDSSATLLLNGDDDLLARVACKQNIRYFGVKNAEFPYKVISTVGESEFLLDQYRFRIPISGIHNIQNASAAILLGKHLGATNQQIQSGLSQFETVGLRQRKETAGSLTLIADCYNASLDSDKAALKVLMQETGSRKVAVLGPIGELGEHLVPILKELGKEVNAHQVDMLICVEEDSRWIQTGAEEAGMNPEKILFFPTKEAFIKEIPHLFSPGDTVLFKASRKYRFEELVEQVKQFQNNHKE